MKAKRWWKGGEDCIFKELHNVYASPKIITAIKSRKMGWAGYVACIEATGIYTIFLSENLKGRHHVEDLGVDER